MTILHLPDSLTKRECYERSARLAAAAAAGYYLPRDLVAGYQRQAFAFAEEGAKK